MASYSCTTDAWGSNTAPRIRLTLTESSSTNTTATYSWRLEYVAQSPAYSVARPYTADIDGTRVASGKYEIDKKKGTFTIASGTKTFNKGTSSRAVVFSCSMNFSITWSGTYGGTMSKSGSLTLPAKIIPTYTISYNANGGSGAPSSQTKKDGETLKLSSTKPTRIGYSFLGWSTSSSATSASYSAGGNFTSNANTTLYAVWSINTYTISYNANGGSGAPSSQTKKYNVTLTLSSTKPTRTNYNFLGWSTSSSATSAIYSPGGSFALNSNTTLYAVWSLAYKKPTIQNLTISRCNENGTFTDSGTSVSVKFNWTTFNNLSSIQAWYKKATDSSWSNVATISGSSSQKSGSINTIIFKSLINADNTYHIFIRVSDSGGHTDSTTLVSSQFVLMDFRNTGKGIAIGKTAEEDLFDVNMDTRFRKAVRSEGDIIAGLGMSNQVSLQGLANSKVNKSDVINNLSNSSTDKPLSAYQGMVLRSSIESANSKINAANSKMTAMQGKCFLAINDTSSNSYTGSTILIKSDSIKLPAGKYIAIASAVIQTSRYTSTLRLNVAGKDVGIGTTNSKTPMRVSVMGHFEITSEKQTSIALRGYGQDSGTAVTAPAYNSYNIIVFKIG